MQQNRDENLETVNTRMMLIIAAYRRMLNHSRKYFCDQLGIANATMEYHEAGRQFVSQDMVKKYARIIADELHYRFEDFYPILYSEAKKIQPQSNINVNVQSLYAIVNIHNHLLFQDMERQDIHWYFKNIARRSSRAPFLSFSSKQLTFSYKKAKIKIDKGNPHLRLAEFFLM